MKGAFVYTALLAAAAPPKGLKDLGVGAELVSLGRQRLQGVDEKIDEIIPKFHKKLRTQKYPAMFGDVTCDDIAFAVNGPATNVYPGDSPKDEPENILPYLWCRVDIMRRSVLELAKVYLYKLHQAGGKMRDSLMKEVEYALTAPQEEAAIVLKKVQAWNKFWKGKEIEAKQDAKKWPPRFKKLKATTKKASVMEKQLVQADWARYKEIVPHTLNPYFDAFTKLFVGLPEYIQYTDKRHLMSQTQAADEFLRQVHRIRERDDMVGTELGRESDQEMKRLTDALVRGTRYSESGKAAVKKVLNGQAELYRLFDRASADITGQTQQRLKGHFDALNVDLRQAFAEELASATTTGAATREAVEQGWGNADASVRKQAGEALEKLRSASEGFLRRSEDLFGELGQRQAKLEGMMGGLQGNVREMTDRLDNQTHTFDDATRSFRRNYRAAWKKITKKTRMLSAGTALASQALGSTMLDALEAELGGAEGRADRLLQGVLKGLGPKLAAIKTVGLDAEKSTAARVNASAGEITHARVQEEKIDRQLQLLNSNISVMQQNVSDLVERESTQADEQYKHLLATHLEPTKAEFERASAELTASAEGIEHQADGVADAIDRHVEAVAGTLAEFEDQAESSAKNHTARVAALKKEFGLFLRAALKSTQGQTDQVGRLMNTVLPGLRKLAGHKMRGLLGGLEATEQSLKSVTKRVVADSGGAEIETAKLVKGTEEEFDKDVVPGLRKEAEGYTQSLERVGESVATQSARLEKEAGQVALTAKAAKQEADGTKHFVANEGGRLEAVAARALYAAEATVGSIGQVERKARDEAEAEATQAAEKQARTLDPVLERVRAEQAEALKFAEKRATSEIEAKAGKVKGSLRAARDESVKLDAAAEAMRSALSEARGEAQNATHWAALVEQQIQAVTTKADRGQLLAAKSTLEQEALINERYKGITDAVAQDVHNLDAGKQRLLAKLVEGAKQTAKRIASAAEMSQAEKEKALAQADAWLKGQLAAVTSDLSEATSEVASADKASGAVDAEAERRLAQLQEKLQDAGPGLAVTAGAQAAENVAMSLEDALQSAQADIADVGTAAETELKERAQKIATDRRSLDTGPFADQATELDAQVSKARGIVSSLESAQKLHEQATVRQAAELDAAVQTGEEVQQALARRLRELGSARERRMGDLKSRQDGYALMTAQSLEEFATTLQSVLDRTRRTLRGEKTALAEKTRRVEALLSSEHAQRLREIGDSDALLDHILAGYDDVEKWQARYGTLTTAWRSNVTEALESLHDEEVAGTRSRKERSGELAKSIAEREKAEEATFAGEADAAGKELGVEIDAAGKTVQKSVARLKDGFAAEGTSEDEAVAQAGDEAARNLDEPAHKLHVLEQEEQSLVQAKLAASAVELAPQDQQRLAEAVQLQAEHAALEAEASSRLHELRKLGLREG